MNAIPNTPPQGNTPHLTDVKTLREQAVTVRQRVRDARIIGIRADAWSGPDVVDVDLMPFRIAFCESPLHVREELLGSGAG